MTRPLVLIVDDDPVLRSSLSDGLDLLGFRVVTAANGLEALAAVEQEEPHVVLLDLQMPVLDGRGFARALKERRQLLPLIVMTGNQDGESVAQKIGATAYIQKPFEFGYMVSALEQTVGSVA
jgi:CheY-like chemotaxis protein